MTHVTVIRAGGSSTGPGARFSMVGRYLCKTVALSVSKPTGDTPSDAEVIDAPESTLLPG